ncbi:MAG: hypothetical protein MUP82_02220 [Candidatus Marinimicrobia bacterium]|nr:hypothetical protein [Candidatus Neomarinimicrobiota bacterium]
MKVYNIYERATDFGSFRSRKNFFSFALKITFYILPAVILGYYTDTTIQTMKSRMVFGPNTIHYILVQTLVNVITFYLLVLFLSDYMSEFQRSIAGSYFGVLYFGVQTNYMDMLRVYMSNL